jgi:hypothetical protein
MKIRIFSVYLAKKDNTRIKNEQRTGNNKGYCKRAWDFSFNCIKSSERAS